MRAPSLAYIGATLLLLLLARAVHGRAPQCAALLCGVGEACDAQFNTLWLAAAQDEAARSYDTRNGGWLAPQCAGAKYAQKVDPYELDAHLTLCIDPDELPDEQCAFKKCDFAAHPELFTDECDDATSAKPLKRRRVWRKHKDDDAACRSLSSWLAIANSKLVDALDGAERNVSEARVASAACVADYLFGRVNALMLDANPGHEEQFVFLSERARATQRYTHINSVARRAMFDGEPSQVDVRVVQSLRACHGAEPNLASLLVYPKAVAEPDVERAGVAQLLWAVGGALSDFGSTVAPVEPMNSCARERVLSNLDAFDDKRRYAKLSPLDYGVVRGDGDARFALDLRAAAKCPLLVLDNNIDASKANNTVVAQVPLRDGKSPFGPAEASLAIEDSLFVRSAAGVGIECEDAAPLAFVDKFAAQMPPAPDNGTDSGNGTLSLDVVLRASRAAALPRTLAPGESQCVGGPRDGQACETASECKAHEMCRRKPFGRRDVAYCYDGLSWDETRDCAFADEHDPCPYGRCVGDVSGAPGGAYPFLYLFTEYDCAHNGSVVCQDERVRNWHAHPSAAAAQIASE